MGSLLAISNAQAGSSAEEIVEQSLSALQQHWDVVHVATQSPDEVFTAVEDHPDVAVVAALGGDGSLHTVVQVLHEADRLATTAVALVPLGSGNDFARTLGLPEDPVAAAQVVAAGTIRPIDLIIDGHDQVVVNAAHVGIGADAAARAAPLKPIIGPIAYALGALSTLFSRAARVRVTIDDEVIAGRVAQVAVGTGRFVGGGGELLPHAIIDDAFMAVSVSFAASLRQRVAYAYHLRRGTQVGQDGVYAVKASRVRVQGDHLRCTSDGELTDPAPIHEWSVVPMGLSMLLPV